MLAIILSLFGLSLTVCGIITVRNPWVYKRRMEFIEKYFINDGEHYRSLPSYDIMLWKFWIWDITKFDSKATK